MSHRQLKTAGNLDAALFFPGICAFCTRLSGQLQTLFLVSSVKSVDVSSHTLIQVIVLKGNFGCVIRNNMTAVTSQN